MHRLVSTRFGQTLRYILLSILKGLPLLKVYYYYNQLPSLWYMTSFEAKQNFSVLFFRMSFSSE